MLPNTTQLRTSFYVFLPFFLSFLSFFFLFFFFSSRGRHGVAVFITACGAKGRRFEYPSRLIFSFFCCENDLRKSRQEKSRAGSCESVRGYTSRGGSGEECGSGGETGNRIRRRLRDRLSVRLSKVD